MSLTFLPRFRPNLSNLKGFERLAYRHDGEKGYDMNAEERIKMVKVMEYITRQINDEEVFEIWLISGVADGDIEYGDLEVRDEDREELAVYIEDESFADLMQTFLRVMRAAYKSGGLYCDGVVSEAAKV